MKVEELIEVLSGYPPDIEVAYQCFSEQVLLEHGDLSVITASKPRPDGWIQDARPDKDSQEYLLFPGN